MIYSHKEPSKPLVVDFATNTVAGDVKQTIFFANKMLKLK